MFTDGRRGVDKPSRMFAFSSSDRLTLRVKRVQRGAKVRLRFRSGLRRTFAVKNISEAVYASRTG